MSATKIFAMKKVACLIFFTTLITLKSYTQFKLSPEEQRRWDSIQQVTQQDYKNMLMQLHIDSVRPGPSRNPQASNAANADETKVPPYIGNTAVDTLLLQTGLRF
jgi:hypothetical protein